MDLLIALFKLSTFNLMILDDFSRMTLNDCWEQGLLSLSQHQKKLDAEMVQFIKQRLSDLGTSVEGGLGFSKGFNSSIDTLAKQAWKFLQSTKGDYREKERKSVSGHLRKTLHEMLPKKKLTHMPTEEGNNTLLSTLRIGISA